MQQISSPFGPQQSDKRKIVEDVFQFLGVLRRGWKFVAVSVLICLTMAGVYLAKTKPVYNASARLLVLHQGGRPISVAGVGDPLASPQSASDTLLTHLAIIRSPVLVERALRSAGLPGLAAGEVIENLAAEQPGSTPNVIDLRFRSGRQEQAGALLEAIVESYKQFLRENYQQSANEVIGLIGEARDDLSAELEELERQYLEFRRESPSHTTEAGGQTFVARRLDQWDRTANQAMTRALQLKSQLELAQRLAREGTGMEAITTALNQLAGVSGGGAISMSAASPEQSGTGEGGSTYDELRAELADVTNRRKTADLLVKNLRVELEAAAAARPIDDSEVARLFAADREVAELKEQLSLARGQLDRVTRVVRQPSDPGRRRLEERAALIEQQLNLLWQQRKPQILAQLRGQNVAILDAEAEVIALRAKEATLLERVEQLRPERIASLRQDRDRFAELRGADHVQVAALDDQIAALERGQDQIERRAPTESLVESLEESLKAIEAMRAEIQDRFEEDLVASKEAEITLLEEENLRMNLERHRTLFDSVAAQLKQAQLVSDFESVTAQVIQPPIIEPVRPNPVFVLLLALIAGCGLGGGCALVADLMDPRVRSLAEMRAALDLPVIATIPQLTPDGGVEVGHLADLSHRAPRSALAESYKSARTNLEFLRRNRNAQVLLISSPNPGDGKSTTSSNLAICLAHAGRRVLLVDGDLRKPSLHTIYNLNRDRGLTQALVDGASMHEIVQETSVENLHLVTTGPDVPDPAEQLSSRRLGALLDEMRPLYDVIIVDSSPFLAVTDPAVISAVADAVLLVVRLEQTRRHDIDRTLELLGTLAAPVLGAVINAVSPQNVGYGQGRGYGYGYGYGRPYGHPIAASAERSASPPQISARPVAPSEENGHHNGEARRG